MACQHVKEDADKKISELEAEKKEYEDFITLVDSVGESINSYADFLTNLGNELSSVRPLGCSYDNGQCLTMAGQLRAMVTGQFQTLKDGANAAITEIDETDIKEQEARKTSSEICSSCQAIINARLYQNSRNGVGYVTRQLY